MDKLPVALFWAIVALIVNPAITTTLRQVMLSSIDTEMPLAALMAVTVSLIFNPITGFAGIIGGVSLWIKSQG